MNKTSTSAKSNWPLVRFIAPAYPAENIFSGARITPLGLVNVATASSKIWGLRVEIIDENNYRGPRDQNGLPDHAALQRENPAAIIGFYCGLTSTIDRVYALSRFYKKTGTFNLAGGWHAHYCPEEALANNMDVVFHGDAEIAIRQVLAGITDGSFRNTPGISFLDPDGQIVTNPPPMNELDDLDSLPYPDFGLIAYANKIKTYPINITRGCRMNCEFCSVNGDLRWTSARQAFGIVNWLVNTRKARGFFIVDDRLEADPREESGSDQPDGSLSRRANLLEFFRLIKVKYGRRLYFTVQIRLKTAEDTEFLEAMEAAGVASVCVGYESPIDEDLRAMRKGLLSENMIRWTKILRRRFWVHGMFIFGYPNKIKSTLSVGETCRRFKEFIRRSGVSSIQILRPVPLVGTDLRARLELAGKLLPREIVPWSKYDGSWACFIPDNMSPEELQEAPMRLMKWFYSRWSFWRIPFRTVMFPFHFLALGWRHWHYGWFRDIVKYGGRRLIIKWQNRHNSREFVERLKEHSAGGPLTKGRISFNS